MYRVTLSPGASSKLSKALRQKAAITMAREARRVADEAVVEAKRLTRERLHYDRPASRRRAGSLRYINAFKAEVVSGTDFPIRVQLRNGSKVAQLIENGSPAHTITKGSKASPGLRIPGPWVPPGTRDGVQHADAYGSTSRVMTSKANHPGTEAYGIMEDALRLAFRKRGARVTPR